MLELEKGGDPFEEEQNRSSYDPVPVIAMSVERIAGRSGRGRREVVKMRDREGRERAERARALVCPSRE